MAVNAALESTATDSESHVPNSFPLRFQLGMEISKLQNSDERPFYPPNSSWIWVKKTQNSSKELQQRGMQEAKEWTQSFQDRCDSVMLLGASNSCSNNIDFVCFPLLGKNDVMTDLLTCRREVDSKELKIFRVVHECNVNNN